MRERERERGYVRVEGDNEDEYVALPMIDCLHNNI